MTGDWPQLTIGELARQAGIATSAIRYYERLGLMPPAERVSGQRRYREDDLRRLSFIAAAQDAGFTLAEIRELADRADDGRDLATPIRELAAAKLPEVRAAIARAEMMRHWLETAGGCDCGSAEECLLFPQPGEDPNALLMHVPAGGGCRRST